MQKPAAFSKLLLVAGIDIRGILFLPHHFFCRQCLLSLKGSCATRSWLTHASYRIIEWKQYSVCFDLFLDTEAGILTNPEIIQAF